jgi:hypothetical protein
METQANNLESTSTPADDEAGALVEFMRHRDVACPACEYNLRNLTSPTCPECGTALVLGVHRAEPFFTAWIVAAVAMAIAGAPGTIILAFVARRGGYILFERHEMLGWWLSIAALPAMPALVRFRLAFLRLGRRTQIALATLCVAIAIVIYGVLISLR